MLIFVVLALVIARSWASFLNFCTTAECQQTLLDITNSINSSASACDDFYQHACGGWMSKTSRPPHEPIWNQWLTLSDKINAKLDYMMNMETPDEASTKARLVYAACLKADDESGHLKQLIADLGGSPLVSEKWGEEGFDWTLPMIKLARLGMHPIVRVFPEVDYADTSKRILYVQSGNVNLPVSILTGANHLGKINLYKQWIYKSIRSLYVIKRQSQIKRDINEMVEFEKKLAKLSDMVDGNNQLSVKKLSKVTKLNWTVILQELFVDTKVNIRSRDLIAVNSLTTLKRIILLTNTTKKGTVANYLMWSLIKAFSRDTTKRMRDLSFIMDKEFLGIKSDVNRNQECISYVKAHFGFALVADYVNLFLKPTVVPVVEQMVHNIKKEFFEVLKGNFWLTQETKAKALEKIVVLRQWVGYPRWVENKTMVADHFQSLSVTDDHFLNVVNIKRFETKMELLKLVNLPDDEQWPVSPFEVNAYYSVLQNSIVIPVGILEKPFFDINRPDVFNYGAIGSLIGHEISHALDTTGRRFDQKGQLSGWWQHRDIAEYEKRSWCFEMQYNRYGIDGSSTIGENIADNVGLAISYAAFKKLKSSIFPLVIPGLGIYENDELFFKSFAQLWCEISNESQMLKEGEHAPVKQRVLGTLHNSERFDAVFNCKNKTRCTLW